MGITHLSLNNFRNLLSVELNPASEGANLIYGQNGSGKTSLLESIYFLSLNRSFKSSSIDKIINYDQNCFTIFAQYKLLNDVFVPLGIEKHQSGVSKIRMNEEDVKASQLTTLIPVRILNSTSHQLIESGPSNRREYIDWGIFYSNNAFLGLWRQFERVLKQRNSALQQRMRRNDLDVWTIKLLEASLQLTQLRADYLEKLLPILKSILSALLPSFEFHFSYYPGWDPEKNYADALNESINKDYDIGYTQFGPHKADLKITINQVPIKDFLSRGQQKLFVCAMILAQGLLLKQSVNKRLIYLVDDLPSELDVENQVRFMTLLREQEAQLFITAIQAEVDFFSNHLNNPTMFHVEHGKVV